jgi:hypothetical protein
MDALTITGTILYKVKVDDANISYAWFHRDCLPAFESAAMIFVEKGGGRSRRRGNNSDAQLARCIIICAHFEINLLHTLFARWRNLMHIHGVCVYSKSTHPGVYCVEISHAITRQQWFKCKIDIDVFVLTPNRPRTNRNWVQFLRAVIFLLFSGFSTSTYSTRSAKFLHSQKTIKWAQLMEPL